ncbi:MULTISPECIES: DUF1254 domain-containing protein [unclassified Gordonia (in: high G+C Gram-positive bacteria)]|uniref:DUF1254 domain-containing protein n=1 Tax=unclassified Gordonia (in: high G+C Gram-positive bacteria) TaxID=2657482 RepID=UPI001F0EE072|nr:DUF1254 domain-containing protein [Gordonia sp. ABSL49_1]MCH5641769.1 DUF1254 domain-containing protein [Gordonia sp. ABSL49_1]
MTSSPNDNLATLAAEAYTYLYPLVTMDVTRRQQTSPRSPSGFGGANRFNHLRAFPTAEFRSVVRPNFDTLYSMVWLDLTGGPVLIEVPEADRYYMLPFLDMWTDVFAAPGTRTTGNGPARYVLVGPGNVGLDNGVIPDVATLIITPTPHVWAIGRVQTNGPSDYATVGKFQDGLSITELTPGNLATTGGDIDVQTEPVRLVNGLSVVEFFAWAAEILAVNPPHPTDFSVLARIARIGLVPGMPFDAAQFDDAALAELEKGRAAALAKITDLSHLAQPVNGWMTLTNSIGVYGNDYLQRARITLLGLGANPADDAAYPVLVADADGTPLDGDNDYVIHFPADGLPPVDAFWSVTMYDAEGYQVANELDRFAIGDRDRLRYNDDGSLDLYLQHADPGADKRDNWLPAPRGTLGVTMRLYQPHPEVLDGRWTPPAVVRR